MFQNSLSNVTPFVSEETISNGYKRVSTPDYLTHHVKHRYSSLPNPGNPKLKSAMSNTTIAPEARRRRNLGQKNTSSSSSNVLQKLKVSLPGFNKVNNEVNETEKKILGADAGETAMTAVATVGIAFIVAYYVAIFALFYYAIKFLYKKTQ
ncbi:MAG: hypothetical protein AABY22_08240 [Nanoarchaeota archaeon]